MDFLLNLTRGEIFALVMACAVFLIPFTKARPRPPRPLTPNFKAVIRAREKEEASRLMENTTQMKTTGADGVALPAEARPPAYLSPEACKQFAGHVAAKRNVGATGVGEANQKGSS